MRLTCRWTTVLGVGLVACWGCGGSGETAGADGGGGDGAHGGPDSTPDGVGPSDSATDARADTGRDGATPDGGQDATAGRDASCSQSDGGALCYAITCNVGGVHTLQDNRDRLIADLARRKCTDSCTLWAALSQAERYIFLMDTAYFGGPASRLYPPANSNQETALDHATALYSINAPDGSTLGGQDYNRIYLGFDSLAACVMRNFTVANPTMGPMGNQWVKSDDIAGPHSPFTQREMIFWYKGTFDPQSEGPQFHHWHQDSDFTQSGIDQRLGVCGVTDRSLVESTIAFDFFHNSDPLGDYATRGGYGWQIVDQYVGIPANWGYMPTGCPMTPPVNTDQYGGGTHAGRGPSQSGGGCTSAALDGGACDGGP
jgi:hypothetical protein